MPINDSQILLQTERLILRQFTSADIDHIFALDNDPDVMRYLNGGLPTERSIIENEILPGFLHYDEAEPSFGFWAVEHKETGDFLGWISLRPTDKTGIEAVLGYRFRKAAWGKGYATEGCRALIDHCFVATDLQRVVATTYEENLASQRVMEKLGMTLVRRFRLTPEEIAKGDTFHTGSDAEPVDVWDGDDVEYAVERTDWTVKS